MITSDEPIAGNQTSQIMQSPYINPRGNNFIISSKLREYKIDWESMVVSLNIIWIYLLYKSKGLTPSTDSFDGLQKSSMIALTIHPVLTHWKV